MNTENMEGLASLGRNEDNYLAHVAAGEMVVPPVITPETRQRLEQEMMSVGLNPNEYKVGNGMSINPITGNPEFGFLKKIGKSLKKVVKKIAPVAAVIPGPWQAPAIMYNKGKAVVNIAKGEGGIGDLMTVFAGGSQKVFGKDGALQSIRSGDFLKAGGGFRDALTGIGSVDGKFNPFQYAKNIGQQYMDDQKSGYFGLFGGGEEMPTVDELATDSQYKTRIERLRSEGLSDAQILQELGMAQATTGIFGGTLGPSLRERFLGSGSGDGFLGGGGSGGGLGNLGIAGLAGLVGKLAYEDAKNFKGVPLTPLTTMDQLGRYNIAAEIARQKGEEMPSRVEYGLTGEGMPVLQGGGTGITPRSAAMGGIMAFADGGVVKMAKGGGASTFSEANASSYIDTLKKKRQDVGNLYMKIPNKYDKQYDNATKNLQNAKTYLTTTNIAAYKDGGIDSLPSAQAKTEFKKFLNYLSTEKMQEGGELDINNFPPMDGDINGPGTETSDDIPAMLSDGEFVMTAKAVKGAGGFDMTANDSNGIVTLTPNGDPSRDSGTRVMYKLMEHFGSAA